MEFFNKKINFLLLLFITFVLIKFSFYFYFGLDNTQGIGYTWQVLDLDLLKNDLINSIFYLHAQPPLWNLFVGLLLKIFNGETEYFYLFLKFYHQCLTAAVIYVFVSIAYTQKIKKKIIFFLVLFLIILNPSIVYFEFLNYYAHTIFFLSCLFAYNIYLYLIHKKNKYLYFCYLTITLKILIWSAYHSLILIIFFIFLQLFFIEARKLKNYIIFFLFLFITLLPNIKNKIIYQNNFNSFLGFNLAISVNNLIDLPECTLGTMPQNFKKFEDIAINKINNKFNINLKHPSIYGIQSKKNSISMLYLSEYCTEKVVNFIINNPLVYIKRVFTEAVSIHGQFIIDLGNYIDSPIGWGSIKKITLKIDKTNSLKIIRQLISFAIMIFFYFYLILILIKGKNILDKKFILILLLKYFYILSIGIFFSKYEGTRFIYGEYILILVFFLYFFAKNHSLFRK